MYTLCACVCVCECECQCVFKTIARWKREFKENKLRLHSLHAFPLFHVPFCCAFNSNCNFCFACGCFCCCWCCCCCCFCPLCSLFKMLLNFPVLCAPCRFDGSPHWFVPCYFPFFFFFFFSFSFSAFYLYILTIALIKA